MHFITRQLARVLLLAPFILTGCGGGDSGGSAPPQTNTGAPLPPGNQFSGGNTAIPPATSGNTVIPPTTGGNTATPTTTGGNTATPTLTGGNTATPTTTGGNTATLPTTGGNSATPTTTGANTAAPTATGSAHTFAYVRGSTGDPHNGLSPMIYTYSVDPSTGAPSELNRTAFPFGWNIALLADPKGRFLYVKTARCVSTASTYTCVYYVETYKINSATGALTKTSELKLNTDSAPNDMVVDLSGKFMYATVYFNDRNPDSQYHPEAFDVWSYRIDDSGTVTPLAAPALSGVGSASYRMHPSGKLVYLSEFAGVRAYAIDSANGTLTPMGPVQTVRLDDLDPTGRFAYGTGVNSDSSEIQIHAYTVGADGTLAVNGPVQTLPPGYGGAGSSVKVAPGGKFAYVLNDYAQTISTYAISPTGTLTIRDTATLAQNDYPYGIFFEPGGKMAYLWSGYMYGPFESVETYTIDSGTGALTRVDVLSAYRANSVTFVNTSQ